jgi:hypothetical protein
MAPPPFLELVNRPIFSDFERKRLKGMTASFQRSRSDMAEIGQLLWFCTNLNGSDRTLLSEVSFLTFPWRNGQNVGGRRHSA